MKTISKLASFIVPISMLASGLNSAFAQGYVVDGSISSQAVGDGTYNYSITLTDEASSMNPVGTFWFAWLPYYYSYDLLTSAPNSITAPSGWAGYTTGPNNYYYADGYGIEFYASGTPLMPGHSLTFGFNSPDAPSVVEGTSPYYPVAATTSFVYMGGAEADPGMQISITVAPEPSSLVLLAFGVVGFAFIGWRRLNSRKLAPIPLQKQ